MFAFTVHKGFYWNKYIFSFGGQDSNGNYRAEIQRFDGISNATNDNSLSNGAANIASANLNSQIYLFGGYYTTYNGSSYVPTYIGTARKFDGYTLSSISASTGSVTEQSADTLGDNAFIFGGKYFTGLIGGGQPDVYQYTVDTIRRFNGTASSTDGAVLQYKMSGMPAQTYGSNIFLFAGSYLSTQGTPNPTWYSTFSIQKYDGSTRTTESASCADSGSGLSTTAIGSYVFIFGKTAIHRFDGVNRVATGVSLTLVNAGAGKLRNNGFTFGGTVSGTNSNAIRKWDGTTLSTLSATLHIAKNSASVCEF